MRIFEDREEKYIQLLVKGTRADLRDVFSNDELTAFHNDDELRAEIAERQLAIEENKEKFSRIKQAKKIMDLEFMQKVLPIAQKAAYDILKNPRHEAHGAIVKAILTGSISYINSMARNLANKDIDAKEENDSSSSPMMFQDNVTLYESES